MNKHPKGLYLLFMTEMWERFSYYGMRAIFTLYMIKALAFSKESSSEVYGTYTGLVYLTPLLGGYIADRYWGNRRSIVFGGLLMALGQFLMFMSASFYTSTGLATGLMWTALCCMIFGNGFFKPNISTMVGQLYSKEDKRVDAAFTMFYMGINLGAFISPLICGALAETGNPADFKWGFLAACIGMILGVITFVMLKDKYIVTPEGASIGIEPNQARDMSENSDSGFTVNQLATWGGVMAALFGVFYLGFKFDFFGALIFALALGFPGLVISDSSLNKIERDRIWVIYIAAFFVIFFWSAFEQAGASLTFFADEQTDRVVNINVSYGVFYSVIGAFAVGLYVLLRSLMDTPREFETAFKVIGAVILGLIIYGFFISNERYDLPQIPTSWFQSINAIAIVAFAPIFSVMWQRLGERNAEPSAPTKQAWGLLLLSLGYVIIAYKVRDLDPTLKVSMLWLIALYVMHTWGELCLSPIGLSMVAKLAPARFASLLMGVWFLANATANKFAGMLSAYYPPTQPEFKKAAEAGIDLPAILNKTAIATPEQLTKLKELELATQWPSFGFEIHNLYDFFNLFVIMAGVASIILFLLSRTLVKMMHGVR